MRPEIHVLGISIKTFGLCFAGAFLAAGGVLARRLRELGKPIDWAYEIIFAGLIGGLVGSHAYYLVQHSDQFNLHGIFSGTGLVWYGGAIGGAIGVCAWAHRRGMLGLALLDLTCVPLALGYAIGRVGCQVSGDGDYGIHTSLPWGMAYPHGTVPTTQHVHPTPIYETVTIGLLTWLMWRWRDRFRPGVLFAIYLIGSGVERLAVEFIRRNAETFAGLTTPQLESIAIMTAGAVWLALVARRSGSLRPTPA
ncbi:MAG TPA: prolipoprotein diacylglyceryl transferase family protein [Solirubrobacteraceae bacterium]